MIAEMCVPPSQPCEHHPRPCLGPAVHDASIGTHIYVILDRLSFSACCWLHNQLGSPYLGYDLSVEGVVHRVGPP